MVEKVLGLIGWAYLVGSMVYLVFRTNAVALLGCMVLLLALYPADRTVHSMIFGSIAILASAGNAGQRINFHHRRRLGTASILPPLEKTGLTARLRFTASFVLGCAAAALLLEGLYGINKNEATPSWCLWACAVTALIWLVFHILSDLGSVHPAAKICAVAGRNVLLAYLLSEMLPSLMSLVRVDEWYDKLGDVNLAAAIARSAALGVVLRATNADEPNRVSP